MDLNNLDSSRNHCNESEFLVYHPIRNVYDGDSIKRKDIASSFKQIFKFCGNLNIMIQCEIKQIRQQRFPIFIPKPI